MKKQLVATIFLSSFLLSGCHMGDKNNKAQSCGGGFASPFPMSVEQQAKSSVLNYLFDNNASAFQKNISAFCVRDSSVGRQESENSDILARVLKQSNTKVESYTVCRSNKDSSISFSGKRAIEFTIYEVSKISDDEYLVRAGYYEGNLSSQTNQYVAKKVGNTWSVTLHEMGPVS